MRIVTDIQIAMNKGWKSAAVFMDLTSAFDTVWHDGLLYKLYLLNLPTSTIRWISQFLTNRTTKIRSGEEFSENISIRRGVPQGAALSPILYSLYVNDTPISPNTNTSLGLFADDTAYWTAARTTNSVIKNLQRPANTFLKWCRDWKLELNAKKTQFIIFYSSGKGTRRDKNKSICINKSKIKPHSTAKYLGVTLDQRLNFKSHISDRRKKGLQAFSALKSILLSNTSFGIKTRIYLSILRPIITYGHELYNSNINMEQFKKFERYWLRVSKRLWKAEKDVLYKDINFPSIIEYMNHCKERYANAIKEKKFAIINFPRRLDMKVMRHQISLQELIN